MRILYIDVLCKSGSTGKIVYELYTRANADGHEAAVAYGRGAELEERNIFKFGLDWETRFHALFTRLTGWTGCFSPRSTKRLLAFMDEFKPDIVHLHEPHAYFLDLAPFFNYLADRKIPLVYTFHCEFAFTGKCGHPLQCENWRTGCGNCPNLRDYPKTLFFDHTAAMLSEKLELLGRQNMIVTSPSQWLADRTARSMLKADVRVIKNGIDSETTFYPRDYRQLAAKHGLENDKVVLAVAPGLMNGHKGGEHVVALAKRFAGEAVKFVLVGLDKSELDRDYPENVIALGRTENQAGLAEYYSMADCFVICSDMENLPTTCLEAVCCGTPVVGFDVGGTVETAPAPLGSFVAYGDMDALEKAVRNMLDAAPAAEFFEEYRLKYSSKYMYEAYLKLYKELLEGKQK